MSDRWFGSAPCETWPNRSFVHAGTSFGRLNNCDGEYTEDCVPDFIPYAGQRTIFDALDEQGVRWAYYQDAAVIGTLLSWQFFTLPQKLRRVARPFFEVSTDLAARTAPQYLFIEPSYGADPNDQHPPHKVASGEQLISNLYKLVAKSPRWARTVLLITHDEHGGCFDHVPPPAAVRPDASPLQFAVGGIDPFQMYGPRVPAVVISPYVAAGTVFRSATQSEYDHGSIMASLRDWLFPGHAGVLGSLNNNRVRVAPTIWPVLTLANARPPAAVSEVLDPEGSMDNPVATTRQLNHVAMAEAERIAIHEALGSSDEPAGGWDTRLIELYDAKRAELEDPALVDELGVAATNTRPTTSLA